MKAVMSMEEYNFEGFDGVWQRVTAREEVPEVPTEPSAPPPEISERLYPKSRAIRFLPEF